VVPVWSRHIEASRRQTELAISRLTARFCGIVEKLEHSSAASASARESVDDKKVRRLAQLSESTGQRMAESVSAIGSAIGTACTSAEKTLVEDDRAVASSEKTIAAVLTSFRDVTEAVSRSAGMLRESGEGIKLEISQALVELQFQDRVSPIMSHVETSLRRLQELAANSEGERSGAGPPDASASLAELQASYTMAEERAPHGTQSASTSSENPVTFF
jgi:methyl-accepting chemotaxis protein